MTNAPNLISQSKPLAPKIITDVSLLSVAKEPIVTHKIKFQERKEI